MGVIELAWKRMSTPEVNTLASKLQAAAESAGHEIDEDDLGNMLFLAFKAGYLAAVTDWRQP